MFLPKIRENYSVLDVDVEPLAEIVLCCGFFMIYFVEDLVHICCGDVDHHDHGRQEAFPINRYTIH